MSIQDSPSLEDFQSGLEAGSQLKQKQSATRITIYVLLAAVVGLFLFSFLSNRNQIHKQGSAVITGKVVDEIQQPLPAEVMVLGTEIKTTASKEGEFTLTNLPPGNVVLVVGFEEMAYQFPYSLDPGEIVNAGTIQYTTTQLPPN